jgi:hypothetical protein
MLTASSNAATSNPKRAVIFRIVSGITLITAEEPLILGEESTKVYVPAAPGYTVFVTLSRFRG